MMKPANPPTPSPATETLPLKDIHLPEPVSWWPPAPGWWLLLAGMMLLTVILFLLRRWYKSRRLQRDIHAELKKIRQQYETTGNKLKLARDLSILLRRAAISWYPHGSEQDRDIAGLTGEDWLAFLDRTGAASDKKFQSDLGRVLLKAPYLPENRHPDFDADALLTLAGSWLLSDHAKGGRKP